MGVWRHFEVRGARRIVEGGVKTRILSVLLSIVVCGCERVGIGEGGRCHKRSRSRWKSGVFGAKMASYKKVLQPLNFNITGGRGIINILYEGNY